MTHDTAYNEALKQLAKLKRQCSRVSRKCREISGGKHRRPRKGESRSQFRTKAPMLPDGEDGRHLSEYLEATR